MCGVPVFHSAGCSPDERSRKTGGISHRSENRDSSRRKRSADVPLKRKAHRRTRRIHLFTIFVRQPNSEKQNEQNYNRAQK